MICRHCSREIVRSDQLCSNDSYCTPIGWSLGGSISEPHRVSEPNYNVCERAVDGKHTADPQSAVQADDTDFIVDYRCKHCGQSGAVAVEPRDIQWG